MNIIFTLISLPQTLTMTLLPDGRSYIPTGYSKRLEVPILQKCPLFYNDLFLKKTNVCINVFTCITSAVCCSQIIFSEKFKLITHIPFSRSEI